MMQNNSGNYRIMVVDEDSRLRKFINIVLSANGYEVIEAYNGKAAVEVASTENPDLIIMDLSLPDVSGSDLVSQIREWSKVPVIVLAASSYDDDTLEALDKLADDFLAKPFTATELLQRVESCLRYSENERDEKLIKIGKLKIDNISEVVTYDLRILALDNLEYKILRVLAANNGRLVSKKQLAKILFDDQASEKIYHLSGSISSILRKLHQADNENSIKIIPEPRIGYRLILEKI